MFSERGALMAHEINLLAGRPDRRTLLWIPGLAGLAPALTSILPRSGGADDGPPVYFGCTGYDDPGLIVAYVEAEGASPEFSFWGDEEE